MGSLQPYIDIAHQLLPADSWNKLMVGLGYIGLLTQVVPGLIAWGVPAATRFADWLVGLALQSPARPLILWKAPAIISFLQDFKSALDKILDTFDSRVQADLAAATAEKMKTNLAAAGTAIAAPDTSNAPKSGA